MARRALMPYPCTVTRPEVLDPETVIVEANASVFTRDSVVEQKAKKIAPRAADGDFILSRAQNSHIACKRALGKLNLDGEKTELLVALFPAHLVHGPIHAHVL